MPGALARSMRICGSTRSILSTRQACSHAMGVLSCGDPRRIIRSLGRTGTSACEVGLRHFLRSCAHHTVGPGSGRGEYGFLAELAGTATVRDSNGNPGKHRMKRPVLPRAFGDVQNGRIERSGYIFQIFLPDASGRGIPESEGGGVGNRGPSARHAETLYCCYAWPVKFRKTGIHSFFMNQAGDVFTAPNQDRQYGGHKNAPDCLAAYRQGMNMVTGRMLRGGGKVQGNDGETWSPAP